MFLCLTPIQRGARCWCVNQSLLEPRKSMSPLNGTGGDLQPLPVNFYPLLRLPVNTQPDYTQTHKSFQHEYAFSTLACPGVILMFVSSILNRVCIQRLERQLSCTSRTERTGKRPHNTRTKVGGGGSRTDGPRRAIWILPPPLQRKPPLNKGVKQHIMQLLVTKNT